MRLGGSGPTPQSGVITLHLTDDEARALAKHLRQAIEDGRRCAGCGVTSAPQPDNLGNVVSPG